MTLRRWRAWLTGQAGGGGETAVLARPEMSAADRAVFDALVMIVDDEPLAVEISQIHLEEAGFRRFVSTSRPAEALRMVRDRKPDVLLLDLMMPRVSGFDILAGMEEMDLLRDVPTIVLTAATDPMTKLKALEHGVTEFITKPVDAIELVLRVTNTLAAKAYWKGCWRAP